MTVSRRSLLVGTAAATIPVPASSQGHAGSHAHSVGPQDSFAPAMHQRMRSMMDAMDAAPTSGDPDRAFLAMMIPHHQGAVDMARLVLVHGRDPLTRQLAEEVIASQTTEIASLSGRLRALEGGATDAGGFPELSGTRGP
ncbi:MAG: hypothetical protein AVDCRST_MAG90-774 [uncultured Microvirga sp.]|uniref:DUF305 domain-containing protein n=1 Tax=uncultured Microvirga sp. TaxID=412392 RepID=A0A6J4KVH7_9HYPH|nr:MAG: hypothetical protein AVDCRST_MAG90-774 [uncultured Microvirga sp.]